LAFFDRFRRSSSAPAPTAFPLSWSSRGIEIGLPVVLADETPDSLRLAIDDAPDQDLIFGAYLVQLGNEGLCEIGRNAVVVLWEQVYRLLEKEEHAGPMAMFGLPQASELIPILDNNGSLSDAQFTLLIDGWLLGGKPSRIESQSGAICKIGGVTTLLPHSAWALQDAVHRFAARGDAQRTQHENELAWGEIRPLAEAAGALYKGPYLESTYVLTPKMLRLVPSKEETAFGRVTRVSPQFDGAPASWLQTFDGYNSVQPHYELSREGRGRVRVVISEPVRKVLEVIKREMPQRLVAGARAEQFLHNPWAFLGDSAREVIDEEMFFVDRAQGGAIDTTFSIVPRVDQGHIGGIDLVVTEHFANGPPRVGSEAFTGPEHFAQFITALERALLAERIHFQWGEFDIALDAESAAQLELARSQHALWVRQPALRITFDDVYELAGYSGRIEGIGIAKVIYVPVIQRPPEKGDGDSGWMPTDLTPMVRVSLEGQGEDVLIPLSNEWVSEFGKQVVKAEASGQLEVANKSLPSAVSTVHARTLFDSFEALIGAQESVNDCRSVTPRAKKLVSETLLVKTNFHGIDYAEERRVSLALPADATALLPKCLRDATGLRPHQLHGIAWFQNLIARAPRDCRGALLADDMGLGKTLQLLTVLAHYYEQNPHAAPSIIFAPKSLLENWNNECDKFFTNSFPERIVLYGDILKEKRQPLGLIDQALQNKGVVELLKPNWVGSAKIVITTYETLTHYEFSFARQPFAFIICDEAQRIKTPGTQVTLAVKKLKADFRIACTGTPVENSLADLWCLFDFVQPGLLGFLEDFGKVYRRPIECETDDHHAALRRLQESIQPQTLRRTKADLAGEFKRKLFGFKGAGEVDVQFKEVLAHDERLEIPMSPHQLVLYKAGLRKLQSAGSETDGRARARLSFGALHHMKAVCAEPYCLPGTKFLLDSKGRDVHLANSPKMAWLLARLEKVKLAGEKAIVFTELRETQLALYYFLKQAFDLRPTIINGDSDGRQKSIDRFSESAGFDVIILSTLAAGAGLNVTAANHVFHFTRAWNPAKENQATDRAFRIGQKRDVYVYCPTVVTDEFSTFEVRVDEIMRRKGGLADSTMDGSGISAMLNGTGGDATFAELMGTESGEKAPLEYLTMDSIDRMDGFSFEVLCEILWTRKGFLTSITEKKGGDGGIDVVALRGAGGELLQCKSSSKDAIGWDAIKEVAAGAARYQARYPNSAFEKVAVTNQTFNEPARIQAAANGVRVVERDELAKILGAHPVSNRAFDSRLLEWLPVSGTERRARG